MTLPRSFTRGLIRVLCAVVLLAQQAALVHVASHASGSSSEQTQHVAKPGDDHSPASELARLCAFDAAFGQVLSGGPASHHAVFAESAPAQTALHRSATAATADALIPHSRGPPVLL